MVVWSMGKQKVLGNTVKILFGVSFNYLWMAGDMNHAPPLFIGHILIRKKTRKAGSFWDLVCVKQFSSLNLTVLEYLPSGSQTHCSESLQGSYLSTRSLPLNSLKECTFHSSRERIWDFFSPSELSLSWTLKSELTSFIHIVLSWPDVRFFDTDFSWPLDNYVVEEKTKVQNNCAWKLTYVQFLGHPGHLLFSKDVS